MAFAFGATPNPDKSEKVGKENEDSSSEIHRIDEAAQQQEIARIGRQLSQLSSRHGGSPTDIFDQDSESPLNPHSASFNGRKWLKAMLDLGAPETQRTAGVSFRNLSAYGFGSDSDWQVRSLALFYAGKRLWCMLVLHRKLLATSLSPQSAPLKGCLVSRVVASKFSTASMDSCCRASF